MASIKMKSTEKEPTVSEGTSLLRPEDTAASQPNVTRFFGLVFLLASPLYLLSALAGLKILGAPGLVGLCIGLAALTPLLSASILTRRASGRRGLDALHARCFHLHRDKFAWYGLALLLGPLLAAVSCGIVQQHVDEIPPPLVPFNLLSLPATLLIFCILASGEEVGWMGYAFDRMQAKSGALPAALVLGSLWALWHVPFYLVLLPPLTVASQVLILLSDRVLACWLYNNTHGSVLAVILYHAADNAVGLLLPDIRGASSPWGPVTMCLVTLVAASTVTLLMEGQTLTQFRW